MKKPHLILALFIALLPIIIIVCSCLGLLLIGPVALMTDNKKNVEASITPITITNPSDYETSPASRSLGDSFFASGAFFCLMPLFSLNAVQAVLIYHDAKTRKIKRASLWALYALFGGLILSLLYISSVRNNPAHQS